MKKTFSIIIVALLGILSSCEKDTLNDPEDLAYKSSHISSLEKQFDYLWHGINNQYVFWDMDSTDWDGVYDKYLPIFRELDKKGKLEGYLSDDEIKDVIEQFASSLIDGHMVIGFSNPYDNWNKVSYSVGTGNLSKRKDYPTMDSVWDLLEVLLGGFYGMDIDSNYNARVKKETVSFLNNEFTLISAEIEDGIVYLRVPVCYFSECNDPMFQSFFNEFSSKVRKLSNTDKLKGIILDFRANQGGLDKDLDFWLQLFIDEPQIIAYERVKNGLGKYDFGEWIPRIVQPDSALHICPPETTVITLVSQYSASAGEMIPAALRTLPNSYSIGTATLGATGSLSVLSTSIFHAGSFNSLQDIGLENSLGAYARMAMKASKIYNTSTHSFECMEGKGFLPDKIVYYGTDDEQLQAAVDYINNGCTIPK